jgi:uncharacterized protein YidB (DUF937 family)
MSILDDVGSLLGGQAPSGLAAQALALLTSNETGGLAGLTSQFKAAGLDKIISSWIGTGENLPISAAQLTEALGGSKIRDIAAGAGLSESNAAGQLAAILPGLIDKLTPDGTIPSQGNLLSQVGSLLSALKSGS